MQEKLKEFFDKYSPAVDRRLERLLKKPFPPAITFLKPQPNRLGKAMHYSLMAGGKRLRPILVLAAAQACGKPPLRALETACAMEMIHTYSLIHDDLPAMDDDDLRRGKPTNHKIFGEAMAILAGDGLLTYAFELIADNAAKAGLPAKAGYELLRVVASGAGMRGMVGGQAADLEAEGWSTASLKNGQRARADKLLQYIHTHKTAALITASLEAGAILAGASQFQRRQLQKYGQSIGLAFQIADDILDVTGNKKLLGKRGSDEANKKLTYVRLHGIEKSRRMAQDLIARAHRALAPFGSRADVLNRLASYIIEREK